MDVDQIAIKIPEGFELDNAEMPASIPLDKIGSYKISAAFNKSTRDLTYQREFVFAKNLGLVFPVASYLRLKSVFDQIHTADNHVITLKQGAGGK